MNANVVKYVMPALIGAAASVLTALITLAASRGGLTDASAATKEATAVTKSAVDEAEALRSVMAVPVGTVVASLLSPMEFSQSVGDPPQFDPKRSLWTLADGKEAPGTRYSDITRRQVVPDLRGLFLRGLNAGRQDYERLGDPDNNRTPGDSQPDDFKSHGHDLPYTVQIYQGPGGQFSSSSGGPDNNVSRPATTSVGGSETRPRNAAVYYYLRVNDARAK